MRIVALPLFLLSLSACVPDAPPPEEKKEAPADTCGVDLATLPGTAWIHLKPQASGADKPNPMARLQFSDKEGKLHAAYTAGSLGDVYQYS